MTITLTFAWWVIPTVITVVSLAIAAFWPSERGGGFLPDLTPVLLMVPALFVSLAAWIVAAIFK